MPDRISVLIVEDESLILMDIADQLEAEGFIVFQAGNADRAIDILSAHSSISLIFTDIDMPGSMDGLKLAEAVQKRWPPVKIIVTSGHRIVDITDMPDGSVFFFQALRSSSRVGIHARNAGDLRSSSRHASRVAVSDML
jgi:CheY-like chemotaxis protein